jgi:ABC-2 type transport system ATP-binding protein
VAEGTPEALKDEIGRPTVEVIPADLGDLERTRQVLTRFGEPADSSPKGAAVRLIEGEAQLAEVVRALDGENIHMAHLQLHAPTLDDVFLARTGRKLDPSEESGEHPAVTEPVA